MQSNPFSLEFEAFQQGKLSAMELAEAILAASGGTTSEGITLDEDRSRRCGFPEVVYGEGKGNASLKVAAERILNQHPEALITRCNLDQAKFLEDNFQFLRWSADSHCARIRRDRMPLTADEMLVDLNQREPVAAPLVSIVTAGTTDLRVALEARDTLNWMGIACNWITDVGVAGPYRLIPHRKTLCSSRVVVVVAGMEAALASVVGGLVDIPVIAVPTSVGYGASLGGIAALLGMLNSCASNVTVVNIDAGFKGGYVAGMIAKPFMSDKNQ